jgi:hypothetical protein
VKAVDERLPQGETTMRTLTKVSARLIATVLAAASWAPVALAQSPSFAAKMNVPFAFETATGQHFGPGVYTIRMEGEHSIIIRGDKTSGLVLTQLADDGLPAQQGKAVFTHYGDKYFLRTVSVAGNASHLICARSKAERQSQIAAGKSATEVELALLGAGR